MTKEELIIAGAMLYACEGTKKRKDKRSENRYIYAIELTNSSPEIISLFVRFLKEVMIIDSSRLRGQLFVYPDHNPNGTFKIRYSHKMDFLRLQETIKDVWRDAGVV